MRSRKTHGKKVVIEAAATTLPAPTLATDGGDLTTWGSGPRTDTAALTIDSDGTGTITGGYIAGYDAQDAKWRNIAPLDGGLTVSLTAGIGFERRLRDVGALDAIQVVGAVTGGITLAIAIKPIERQ